MPAVGLVVAAFSMGIAGFDSWLTWRESEQERKLVTTQTVMLAAAIAAAMYFAVKAARR